jgi:SAM-dependent methyltransferase
LILRGRCLLGAQRFGFVIKMAEDEYYYIATRENLLRALSDHSGVKPVIDDVGALEVGRVLDVGCGIGQALFPLAVRKGALGVGVDVSALGLRMGREFFAKHLPGARVTFIQAAAESLPFAPDSFDLVNCGLALPYMRNSRAIAEVARVLRPGGVFLLKIHHARYYLRELWQGLTTGDLPSVVHGGRVLAAGTLYHLVRRQPRVRLLNESYQTRWRLRHELAKHGMVIEREQIKTNPLTPAFVIRKKQPTS